MDSFEANVQDGGEGADHECFGQAGDSFQQTMSTGEDGGEKLFDDLILADDDLLQLLLHHQSMLAELLQDISQTACFGGHVRFTFA